MQIWALRENDAPPPSACLAHALHLELASYVCCAGSSENFSGVGEEPLWKRQQQARDEARAYHAGAGGTLAQWQQHEATIRPLAVSAEKEEPLRRRMQRRQAEDDDGNVAALSERRRDLAEIAALSERAGGNGDVAVQRSVRVVPEPWDVESLHTRQQLHFRTPTPTTPEALNEGGGVHDHHCGYGGGGGGSGVRGDGSGTFSPNSPGSPSSSRPRSPPPDESHLWVSTDEIHSPPMERHGSVSVWRGKQPLSSAWGCRSPAKYCQGAMHQLAKDGGMAASSARGDSGKARGAASADTHPPLSSTPCHAPPPALPRKPPQAGGGGAFPSQASLLARPATAQHTAPPSSTPFAWGRRNEDSDSALAVAEHRRCESTFTVDSARPSTAGTGVCGLSALPGCPQPLETSSGAEPRQRRLPDGSARKAAVSSDATPRRRLRMPVGLGLSAAQQLAPLPDSSAATNEAPPITTSFAEPVVLGQALKLVRPTPIAADAPRAASAGHASSNPWPHARGADAPQESGEWAHWCSRAVSSEQRRRDREGSVGALSGMGRALGTVQPRVDLGVYLGEFVSKQRLAVPPSDRTPEPSGETRSTVENSPYAPTD